MVRARGLYPRFLIICRRGLHTSSRSSYFYQQKGSGYPPVYDNPPEENLSILGRIRGGCYHIKNELTLLGKEIREQMRFHKPEVVPNEDDILWKFDGTNESRNQWVVTCDSDYNHGFSEVKLDFSSKGTGIFHGTLNTTLPKDGKTIKGGFCNMTTVRKRKSFMREAYYDWSAYTHLVMRVRGDGRSYMLNIREQGWQDVNWYNGHHYLLYTRGGPYWQHVKLPFSRFVFASKGAIQDFQLDFDSSSVTHFGITLSDRKPGPFRLEIDYIGVCYDPYHTEENAYEWYDLRKS